MEKLKSFAKSFTMAARDGRALYYTRERIAPPEYLWGHEVGGGAKIRGLSDGMVSSVLFSKWRE